MTETNMVCVLFMEMEEMIYKEEENDNQAAHKEKEQMADTKNKNKNKKPPQQVRNKSTQKTKKKHKMKACQPKQENMTGCIITTCQVRQQSWMRKRNLPTEQKSKVEVDQDKSED